MKFLILSITALTAFSTLADAGSLPRVLETKIEQMALGAAKRSASQIQKFRGDGCADFSGKYAGSCVSGDKKEEVSFTITQEGCKTLKIDEDTLNVGGHGVVGVTPEVGTFVAASWNTGLSSDGQTLMLNVGFTADLLNNNLPLGGRVFGAAHKNGNELVIRGIADVWLAEKSIAQAQVDCSLQKQ